MTTGPHADPASQGAPSYNMRPSAPPANKGNGLAITGFVLAVVALLLCLVPIINNFAAILAVLALAFAIPAFLGARKGRRSGKGLALSSIIVAVLSLVGVLASQALYGKALDEVGKSLGSATGENTDDVLKTMADVKLGKFTVSPDGFNSELPVTITNKTSGKASFSVTIEATDANGDRIE